MDESLLDTDMLNEVMKARDLNVIRNTSAYLNQFPELAFSSMTRYEVLRGVLETGATAQRVRLEAFCRNSLILPVTDAILERAAHLWAEGRGQGRNPKDADLVIAATALEHDRVLVTGNTRHFQWIPGLVVENWRNP
jgi:tRNA(fMet)-specific endonuclease VapC